MKSKDPKKTDPKQKGRARRKEAAPPDGNGNSGENATDPRQDYPPDPGVGVPSQLPARVKRVVMELPVHFTKEELLKLGDQLSEATTALEAAEDRKKEITAQLSADLKACDAHLKAVNRKLVAKYEMRSVDCHEIADHVKCEIFTRRLDTGLEVSRRPMTERERQLSLPIVGDIESRPIGEGASA